MSRSVRPSKAELEAQLASRFGDALKLREKSHKEALPTGIAELDAIAEGGLPRGAITEILGPASSGRTSVLLSILAEATARQEVCALVDACDAFDVQSGSDAGIDFERLLWVGCDSNPENALRAAEILLQSGGFGLVVLDLGDVKSYAIPSNTWFRLRRAIEGTPTCLLVIEREPNARPCAALTLEMERQTGIWSGSPGVEPDNIQSWSIVLRGAKLHIERRKPVKSMIPRVDIETSVEFGK